MTTLFAYGTLMFPEIWRRIADRDFDSVPATLSGFAVFRIRRDLYPVMVPDSTRVVTGLVYRDLDAAMIGRLDSYESDMYDRVAVEAQLTSGERLACEAYVLAERFRQLRSDQPWTAEWFRREAMAEYLKRFGDE
mgnify:FL=1